MVETSIHKLRVQRSLERGDNPFFEIIEPCCLNNLGVLPMPASVDYRRNNEDIVALTLAGGAASRFGLGKPKLDVAVTSAGHSFLDLKILENQSLKTITKQAFIIPENRQATKNNFETIATQYIQQGKSFKTPAWSRKLAPILDDNNSQYYVPAGHGTLVKTFGRIANNFPSSKGLWIRNIDNVVGWSHEVQDTTNRFLDFFVAVYSQIQKIRKIKHEEENPDLYLNMLQSITRILDVDGPSEAAALEKFIFTKIFHGSLDWSKPFSVLGMVANSGKDGGGAPFLVRYQGRVIKVCLESPHYSPNDKQKYADNPQPYFNPVFLATELKSMEFRSDHPFWAITRKSTKKYGEYFFHEEFLSEILGNSLEMNTIFIEIPRFLFKPHKKLEDLQGVSIESLS